DVATHIADNGKIAFAPEITTVTRRAAVKVLRGDTMAKVAQRHGVSVTNLAQWNEIKPGAKLRAGQSLDVYKTVRVSASGTSGSAHRTKHAKNSSRPAITKKKAATKVVQKRKAAAPKKKQR
ncbi:MAG: LysM peptidoglycan-binding domain-containing protein, partial [Comamonas sp.]|nr:LysM peptidoglycan-binding domain-containing protein [Candidatus Comamonas equi]